MGSLTGFAQWNTDRIMNIGRNAYYFEDYVLSIQYFNQVIKIKPYLAEPYMYRGMAKISLGDFAGAELDCDEAIERNPFIPYAYYTRGFARKNLQKYDEAIKDFNKALEFDPDNSNFVANRIEARERNKDYEGAIEDLYLFKQMNPKAKGIEYEIGRILLSANDTVAAEKMILKTIEVDSTMEMGYKLLAHIQDKRDDQEGAVATLNKLKAINPRSENLELELGRLYLGLQDTLLARESFNRAIYNAPRSPYAYGARGFINMLENREDEALEDYSKAIEYGSDFSGDYINRGILNVKKYNFNQALNDYNYAILMDRTNSLAYYNRALLRNNLGDKNNALNDLERVMELDPNNNEALLQQASLQLELGYLDEAIANFEQILKMYKYFAHAYYSLAEAYEKKGQPRLARNYRSLVFEIVNNKDYYQRKQNLEPKNQIVRATQSETFVSKETLADKLSSQSESKFRKTDYTENNLRGKIQESYTELQYPEYANFSFERPDSLLSGTNRFHELIHRFNQNSHPSKDIYIDIRTSSVSAGQIHPHFEHIDLLTKAIKEHPEKRSQLYLTRAIEFQLVKDYSSALEDLNNSIGLDNKNALAYFVRANVLIQHSETEHIQSIEDTFEEDGEQQKQLAVRERNRITMLKISDDFDSALSLSPEFSFAWYNKANYLAGLKDYKGAIKAYTRALEIDPSFAEAYFGRGLSYIFINEENPARADLSKAGELGVYKSYNLLNRLVSK